MFASPITGVPLNGVTYPGVSHMELWLIQTEYTERASDSVLAAIPFLTSFVVNGTGVDPDSNLDLLVYQTGALATTPQASPRQASWRITQT